MPRKRCWLSSQFSLVSTWVAIKSIVSSLMHFGHIINSELSDKDDILRRRCTFIGQVNDILCYLP